MKVTTTDRAMRVIRTVQLMLPEYDTAVIVIRDENGVVNAAVHCSDDMDIGSELVAGEGDTLAAAIKDLEKTVIHRVDAMNKALDLASPDGDT